MNYGLPTAGNMYAGQSQGYGGLGSYAAPADYGGPGTSYAQPGGLGAGYSAAAYGAPTYGAAGAGFYGTAQPSMFAGAGTYGGMSVPQSNSFTAYTAPRSSSFTSYTGAQNPSYAYNVYGTQAQPYADAGSYVPPATYAAVGAAGPSSYVPAGSQTLSYVPSATQGAGALPNSGSFIAGPPGGGLPTMGGSFIAAPQFQFFPENTPGYEAAVASLKPGGAVSKPNARPPASSNGNVQPASKPGAPDAKPVKPTVTKKSSSKKSKKCCGC